MQIPISSIETILQQLLSYAREIGVETVEIPVDYYWVVSDKDIYDMSLSKEAAGASLGVGSLEYDWELLSKVLSEGPDGDGYSSLDYPLAASLLRAIGDYLYDNQRASTVRTSTL